jgi:hypothetical protein
MSAAGKLIGVGVGPGDPELMTLKALRALKAADVVAHFAKAGNASRARAIAADHLAPGVTELSLRYPVTTELPRGGAAYCNRIKEFFDASAAEVAAHLDAGRTVAVVCEGDPLFYGSYMHLHARHVGLLVGGRHADRARERRVHRAAGDAAADRARAPPRRRRCHRDHEAWSQLGEGAARPRSRQTLGARDLC